MPPDHSTATSAPLFVQDLPVGTVSVRIARPSMTDPVAGAKVVGAWTTPAGKPGGATIKTGEDGRAIFSAVPVGATFGAKATVDGEELSTAEFPVPDQGGTRLLLIVGGHAAEAMAEMTGQTPHGASAGGGAKALGVRSGKIEPRDNLPAGAVEISVLGADGKPIPGVRVDLARAQRTGGGVDVKHAESDASGIARFAELEGGQATPWAAVVERDGMRVATQPFALAAEHGSAGELRIPSKTSDLGVLRVSANSRMMVELREDSLAILQNLIIENPSDKVFDPGPQGLLVPLPSGCTGTEKLSGGADFEIKEGAGVILRSLLPPTDSPAAAAQVRIGCVLAMHEAPEVEIVQPMPLGLQGATAMIPATNSVALSAPGLRARPAERDDNGNDLRMYELDSVAPGRSLRLTVYGLPTHGQTGKWIAGLLAGLLVAGGIVAVRRPRKAAAPGEHAG